MHLRFVYRQISSSPKQTLVFVASVALSIVTLVAIGGFGESVNNALLRDARKLLAGDIVVESGFPFTDALLAELDGLRKEPDVRVARTYEFITIVRTAGGEDSLLSEIKAVDPGYPFYGEVGLASGMGIGQALKSGQILAAQNLLDRLGLRVGDPLQVGSATLTIADVVLSEPDQPVDFFNLGPRIFLSAEDLPATGLIRPGSRVTFRALVQVADEPQVDIVAERLSEAADARQERVDSYLTNQSSVQRFFEDFLTFLNLVGIFTLLLAGIGIQSSLSSFIREREGTIAILRTVGATGRFIMVQFYAVATILGVAGTGLGLILGVALQAIFPIIFKPFLPPQVDFVLSMRAIVEGMVLGFVVATIFTLLPIYQLQGFKPRFIFRKEATTATRTKVFFLAQGLILLFLSAMTFRYLQNTLRTAYFAVGLVSLILVITLLTRAVLFLLKRQKIKALDIRQAVRGLFRPRNVTAGIIVTLAASLSVLFTIFLIERNLAASFVQAYPADAPNIILLDIQPDQRQGIREFLSADAEFVPLVLARISRINGTAVVRDETDTPQFGPDQGPDGPIELDSLFPTTYRDELAAGERLVEPGLMFSPEDLGMAQVSISDRVLQAYPFSIGDRIQFEIQGVNLEAQVTSIRAWREEQASFGPRFNFVFREQDLIGAPQTIVTAATIPEGEVSDFQNRLVSIYPNVTVINISAAIDVLAVLVEDITVVIRFFSVFSIVAGVLIIISSVLATQYARIQESVYYKVLGAKRRFVLKVFALENIFIGLVSALLALFLSQVASWLLITQVFEISYAAFWGPSVLLMVFTIALVTTVGLLASVSILNKKPISFLREQSVE